MSEFRKERGHRCWWLNVDGVSMANFEDREECTVDEIAGMSETIAKQAKELEAANNRVSELEKAGEDLFHGRIGGDSHWAITCGLRLAES